MSEKIESQLRLAGMNLLARREYSRLELVRKLQAKFPEQAERIGPVLDRLADDGLQSDQRFAESFISARIHRGHGPQRIAAELRERGVDEALAEICIEEADVDWCQLATEVAVKRFGHRPAEDYQERAKRMRFLQYRGFSSKHIAGVL